MIDFTSSFIENLNSKFMLTATPNLALIIKEKKTFFFENFKTLMKIKV